MRTHPDPRSRRPGGPRRPVVPPPRHGTSHLTYERVRELGARPAFRSRGAGHGSLLALGVLIGVALAVALFSLGLQRIYAGRIYPRVVVNGLPLDGRTPAEARTLLWDIQRKQITMPVTLQGNGRQWPVSPARFGAHYDVEGAVRACYAVGRTGAWYERLLAQGRTVFQGTALSMRGSFDRQRLNAFVTSLAPAIKVDPLPAIVGEKEGRIAILRPPVPGQQLDTSGAVQAVVTALQAGQTQAINLPTILVQSAINGQVAQAAIDSTRNLLAGPVLFTYANAPYPWQLNPDGLARLLTFTPARDHSGWTLRADIDRAKLATTLRGAGRTILKPAHDATYIVAGDYVTVAPDLPGSALDMNATAQELLALANGQGARTIYLPTRPVAARFDTAKARALHFDALMASGSASWAALATTAGPTLTRNQAHNAALAINHLNNLRLEPGQTLTFTQAAGPINARGDYYPGLNKLGPRDVAGYYGGVTQVGSALYRAAYFAGLGIAGRVALPHFSEMASQIGLDAATYGLGAAPQLVITNTTSHPVLIMADLSGPDQQVHIYLYNTRSAVPDVQSALPTVMTHADGRVDVTYQRAVSGAALPGDGPEAVTHYAPLEAP